MSNRLYSFRDYYFNKSNKVKFESFYYLVFISIIISCSNIQTKKQDHHEINEKDQNGTDKHKVSKDLTCFTLITQEYSDSIHPSLPPVHVELIFDPNTYTRTIFISMSLDSWHNQLIDVDVGEHLTYDDDLKIIDVNFDGYKDIMLLGSWGATGNMSYDYYTFDIQNMKFNYRPELGILSSPRFDSLTKRIQTGWNGGMAGTIYGSEIYEFQNDSLKLIHSVYQNFDQSTNHYTRKTRFMKHGKLIDSTTVIFPPKKW